MENQGEDLFNIKIDPNGAASIEKLYRITKWLIVLTFVGGFVIVSNLVFEFYLYHPEKFVKRPFLYFEVKFRPYFMAVYLAFFFYQWYLYFRFAKESRTGLGTQDSDRFNRSFSFLYRANVLAAVNFLFTLLMALLSLMVNFEWASAG